MFDLTWLIAGDGIHWGGGKGKVSSLAKPLELQYYFAPCFLMNVWIKSKTSTCANFHFQLFRQTKQFLCKAPRKKKNWDCLHAASRKARPLPKADDRTEKKPNELIRLIRISSAERDAQPISFSARSKRQSVGGAGRLIPAPRWTVPDRCFWPDQIAGKRKNWCLRTHKRDMLPTQKHLRCQRWGVLSLFHGHPHNTELDSIQSTWPWSLINVS